MKGSEKERQFDNELRQKQQRIEELENIIASLSSELQRKDIECKDSAKRLEEAEKQIRE